MNSIYSLLLLLLMISTAESNNVLLHTTLHDNNGSDINSDKLIVHNNALYVGGSNYILKVTIGGKGATNDVLKINFTSLPSDLRTCQQYSVDVPCENTVRILEVIQDDYLLVCGTNAGRPKCHFLNITDFSFIPANLDAANWLSEYPDGSTTSLLLGNNLTDAELYVGSTKTSYALFCKKISKSLKSDKPWLNDPEFTGIYAAGEKVDNVYVFFNEKSSKFSGEKFVGANEKVDYYSMVARVCTNDEGGSWKKNTWMTFNKARLVCPWPGVDIDKSENLFYDELVSTDVSGDTVYGIFRTNRKWNLNNFAICRFNIKSIDAVIEGKFFVDNKTEYVNEINTDEGITFTSEELNPPFSPGKCPNSSHYSLKSSFELFVTKNTLVRMNIFPDGGKPFYVTDDDAEFKFIFAESLGSSSVIFLLSDEGFLKKLKQTSDVISTSLLFQTKVDLKTEKILTAKLLVVKGVIVATTKTKIITIPTNMCRTYTDCGSCHMDPHCQWQFNETDTSFSCHAMKSSTLRSCALPPEKPIISPIKWLKGEVGISWTQPGNTDGFSLIKIWRKGCKHNLLSRYTKDKSVKIDRAKLQDGAVFEVAVTSVNDSSLSEESILEFSTELQSPRITYSCQQHGIATITWMKVEGAEKYVIKIMSKDGNIVQDVWVFPTSDILRFDFSNVQQGDTYTAVVTVVSKDNLKSVGDLIFVQGTISQPCHSLGPALAIFVALFVISLCIILHNTWAIKPSVSMLKDEPNRCSYKRQYLLIWRKTNHIQDDIKFDEDDAVSTTRA